MYIYYTCLYIYILLLIMIINIISNSILCDSTYVRLHAYGVLAAALCCWCTRPPERPPKLTTPNIALTPRNKNFRSP